MKRMRKAMAAAMVVLAAMSAYAQEADAETRFHRAYEREVVDGKVADAAREYLAMMDDEKFPERLRLEAKFRFAVTAMLLGRADEARVHLGALASDAKAPETLRARATEYLDAAKGVGVGNEIDKKLQSLVFDLAKDKEPVPAAYRDFQVIGKRAVPFLRQLLQHEDLGLRSHAFRILLGMREPGMVDLWTPKLTSWGHPQTAFTSYLTDRPDDRVAFEKKLLALDDETLRKVLAEWNAARPPYSAETVRAFAARKVAPKVLVDCLPYPPGEEFERVRGEWIRSDDSELSAEATLSYLTFVRSLPEGKTALRTEVFPAIVARLETMDLDSIPGGYRGVPGTELRDKGLLRLAAAVPAESILEVLAKTVESGIAAPVGVTNPLQSGLVDTLATAFDRRDLQAELPARYGEILKSWFTEVSKRELRVPEPAFAWHVATAASRMPEDAATALAVWAVTTPLHGLSADQRAQAVPVYRARNVGVAMAAARAAAPAVRVKVLNSVANAGQRTPTTPELARAVLGVLPEIVRLWLVDAPPNEWPPTGNFIYYARVLPTEEGRERFVELALAVEEWTDEKRRQGLLSNHMLGVNPPNQEDRSAYWADVALPSLDGVWSKLAVGERVTLIRDVLQLLTVGPRDPTLRTAIRKFIATRYAEVPDYAAGFLVSAADVFPLAEWVPNVCPDSGVNNNAARVPSERADPAVRDMTTDVASVNAAVLQFTSMSASPEVQRDVFDRMLRTGPIELMDVVSLNARLASADAIEEGIGRMVAEKAPDANALGRLVVRLRTVRPSEALFPAVRALLRSDEVTTGIETAKFLGREELLPDLAGLLDSMDSTVRTAAKEAIDSIVDLRKLKEEARRGAGGK